LLIATAEAAGLGKRRLVELVFEQPDANVVGDAVGYVVDLGPGYGEVAAVERCDDR